MKLGLVAAIIVMSASSALACSYAPIPHRGNLSAAQRVELQKDEQTVAQLRRDMSTVCAVTKTAAINSCQHSKGACADLPFELQDKFRYDFGADGSVKGMVSPEDRTKNAEIINTIYNKWKS